MNLSDILNEIQSFPFASCLNEDEIIYLIKSGELRTIEKHHNIFEAGQPSTEIFFLFKGVVKITTLVSDGREVIKTILHPKAILGEQSITGEDIRTNFAAVMSPNAVVLALKVQTIRELMQKNIHLADCIISFLGNKLKYSEERLESMLLNDARERIVQFLKFNAQSFGMPVGYELLLRHDFTQQDIANFTGTSRQTVTTVLNDLKKKNKIHFKRKSILIRDVKSLV
jgi:CRP-like cAMP-binding protein